MWGSTKAKPKTPWRVPSSLIASASCAIGALKISVYRASGLNLVVAAIVLWNTVYLERAIGGLRHQGQAVDDRLLAHLSPLGWEHVNLTGDYAWHANKRVAKGRFRPFPKTP